MKEYTDAGACALQELAFQGDLAAAHTLIGVCEAFAKAHIRKSTVPPAYHEDIYHDYVVRIIQRVASGCPVPMWASWCMYEIRLVVARYIQKEKNRSRLKDKYMQKQVFRVNFTYPVLHECVHMLDGNESDMIRRLYFRPQRQTLRDYSIEYGISYSAALWQRTLILRKLRALLEERGVRHA